VDIQLGVDATPVADGLFEVSVTATVQTKIADKTVFLVEAKQAGILKSATCPPTRWARSWALPARKSSTPTCAATWPT
jgi:preprotein translocase subunit SecB